MLVAVAAGVSSESQPASSAAAPPARPAPSTARRDERVTCPSWRGWLGGAMSASGSTRDCDVVVLGLGPGGEHAARKLGEAGLDVIGVDEALVGGECPFWGCTPSKLMVRPADLIAEVRRADRLAGEALVWPDWSLVAARIREANHDWTDGQHVEPLEHAGVRIVRGHGRLDGPGVVRVEQDGDTTVLRASRGVLLNTGTEPLRPPIAGLAATPYWTNRETMQATEVPDRLVVVGGGPNGLELAQVFARYGAQVTLLELADRIAASEEPEAGDVLTTVLRDEGIEVRAGVEIERVDHDGVFHVHVGGQVLDADELLVAAGRSPNLADVGLETVGLDPEADTRRDRRAHAGRRAALGGRRHHREGRVHPRLALPGRRRGRGHPRQGRAAGGLPCGLPGHVHRPGAGVGRDDRGPGPRGRALGPGRAGADRAVRPGLAARTGHHRHRQGGRGRRPGRAGGRDRRGAVRRGGDRDARDRGARARCPSRGCGRCTTPTRPSTGRSRRR